MFVRIAQIEPMRQLTPPTAMKSGLRKPLSTKKGINSPSQKRSFLPKPGTAKNSPDSKDHTPSSSAAQHPDTLPTDTVDMEEVIKPTSFAVSHH